MLRSFKERLYVIILLQVFLDSCFCWKIRGFKIYEVVSRSFLGAWSWIFVVHNFSSSIIFIIVIFFLRRNLVASLLEYISTLPRLFFTLWRWNQPASIHINLCLNRPIWRQLSAKRLLLPLYWFQIRARCFLWTLIMNHRRSFIRVLRRIRHILLKLDRLLPLKIFLIINTLRSNNTFFFRYSKSVLLMIIIFGTFRPWWVLFR